MKYAILENNIVVNIIKASPEFISEQNLIGVAITNEIVNLGDTYANGVFTAPSIDMPAFVDAKIKKYQELAPQLLRELYVTNTLAGITTAQSDQMFDDFQDVLVRITQGAFPTAVYRLQQKSPSGFCTQDLIDAWITKIQGYLG